MTPEEALRAATANGADLLGMRVDLGDVSPGKFADLVAVEGDPLADIQVVITKVRGVSGHAGCDIPASRVASLLIARSLYL
jgi:imidazolonepropionase-like amidohydrolase